jgi:starch synthase
MKIAFASSEVYPFAKTGGLGDVVGTLPAEISKLGHEVIVFLPKYNTITIEEHNLKFCSDLGEIPIRVGTKSHMVQVYSTKLPGSNVNVFFIDCPHYFCRFEIYTKDKDEDERFILFSRSVIEIMQRLKFPADILHCNDWHTGLLPILLKENYAWDKLFAKTATVFTIHNIAYQGVFSKDTFAKADINPEHTLPFGIGEYYGKINFLKTAILTSDVINTVSETYVKELLTEEFGAGMEIYLKQRVKDFFGILNGVDYNIWNPEMDVFIPSHYSASDISPKAKNKKALLKRINLPADEKSPLIGIISRLVEQKGLSLFENFADEFMKLDASWVILGNGEPKYEEMLSAMAKKYPQKISLYLGYYDELSHMIEAGADIFLMPSRFEPCGLNQIFSLKYGTVPVVRNTGGLADTVEDWNTSLAAGKESGTGFSFKEFKSQMLLDALQRALNLYKDKQTWKKIQVNGMNKDYSWKKSAEKYISLYERAIQKKKHG